ncbi:hypothetical protein [Streptomyces sp. NPDC058874]|uniref:hypothetical protein n=1 Tax=unclassified Streptomyces TaxID=2593676 RepID=UPI00367BD57D
MIEWRVQGLLGGEGAGVDDAADRVHPADGGLLVLGCAPAVVGAHDFVAFGVLGKLPTGRDPLLEHHRVGVHDEVLEAAVGLA